MKTKVGAPAFDDPVRRFAVAVPSAIVLTALCFAFIHYQPAERPLAETAPPATVVLERRPPTPPPPTPAPRPPTPPPTLPPVPRVTLAPVPERAAPRAVRAPGGGHAAPKPHPQVVVPSVVVAGSGGGAGNGTGGTGSGTGNADAPCGEVDFIPFQAPDHSGSITYEHVLATVTFPDGHKQSAEFPYRWAYANPADDPWSAINLPNPNFLTRMQPPPPDTDLSRYSDTIRYIINHTRSDGTTVLQDCPPQP
jgi:hypothetical protein